MRSFFRGVFVLLLLNVAVQRTEAKNLKVAFGLDRPPYIYQDSGKWRGIEVEIVGEVLRRLGYELQPEKMSSLRLEAEAQHGNSYDLVVGVANGPEGAVYYSDPYVYFENYVIALKKKNLALKTLKDLAPYKVGTWLNAWKELGSEYRSLFSPRLSGFNPNNREFLKQEEQCISFWQGHVDAIVIDKHVFDWYRMTLATKVDTSREVVVHKLLPQKSPSFVAFRNKTLRDSFNAELAKMRQSGDYDRIVHSHVGEQLAGVVPVKNKVR